MDRKYKGKKKGKRVQKRQRGSGSEGDSQDEEDRKRIAADDPDRRTYFADEGKATSNEDEFQLEEIPPDHPFNQQPPVNPPVNPPVPGQKMSEKDEMDIAVTAIRRSAAVATRETIGNYAMGQDLGGDLEKDIDKEYNRIASLAFSPLENPIKLINGMSPTLLKTPLYIKKRPVAGAVASQMSFIEPEHLAYIRRTARGIYKNVVFMRGHGIKEGSKKYPISLFLGAEKDVSYATALAEHKDAWKANMMYRIYRPGFLKNPKTLNYQFVTSKGFHSLVLGSKQRRKGHRAKRASKRAGKAARKALKK